MHGADHLHGPDRGGAGDDAALHAHQAQEIKPHPPPRSAGRTWPAPTKRRTSCARSWTSCAIRSASASSGRRCRRASCCTAPRAPARRCWRRRWPTRPTKFFAQPPRRSSRCSPASAPLASGGYSGSRARRRPRSFIDELDAVGATAARTSRARRTRRSTSCSWSSTASAPPTTWWHRRLQPARQARPRAAAPRPLRPPDLVTAPDLKGRRAILDVHTR